MACRRIGLLALLGLAVIPYCSGCAPLESGTPWKMGSASTDFDHFHAVKLRGALQDRGGMRLTGVVSVLFAIYEQPKEGAPLWQEVQNVELDTQGRFTAVVGSTNSEGIPAYLFTAEKTRWLGEQVMLPGEVEQPRFQLVSTSQGLTVERGMWQAIPPEPGKQPVSTKAQESSGTIVDSQESSPQDSGEPDRQPSRVRPRFHSNLD